MELLGKVAIVGYPNVGKSTLINRLTATRARRGPRDAGRDPGSQGARLRNGKRFAIVDTGGMDVVDASPMARSVVGQATAAIEEADLVLLVVDARAGVTPGDEELAAILRRSKRPVLVLANKVDEPSNEALTHEFHRLGLGEPVPVSAMHGHGTGDLLDEIVARLPGGGHAETGEEAIRVAILGRPNVGKSSLLNGLLHGAQRRFVADASHGRCAADAVSDSCPPSSGLRRRFDPASLAADIDGLVTDAGNLAAVLEDLLLAADPRGTTADEPSILAAHRAQVVAVVARPSRPGVDLSCDATEPVVVTVVAGRRDPPGLDRPRRQRRSRYATGEVDRARRTERAR